MEVITFYGNKKTILLITQTAFDWSRVLSDEYNILVTSELSEAYQAVSQLRSPFSAVLIDAFLSENGCEQFLKEVQKNMLLQHIPVLVTVPADQTEQTVKFLSFGATDVISLPCCKEILKKRISNAMHIKDSVTYSQLENMLRALPSNIYLKDAKGKYIFATHYWHHLDHKNDPDWTIRGKTDIDIRKDRENAVKAYHADLELLQTGKGTSYLIEVNADNVLDILEINKYPVLDDENQIIGIIGLINNVTEQELLKRQLEQQAYHDHLTGLYNRSYYAKYIHELSEACFPLSIISADCNKLKYINDYYGHLVGDEYIRITASLFRMVLPENAVMFRTGGDEFLLFLPHTEEQQALEFVELLRKQGKLFSIRDLQISISYGVSVMQNMEQDMKECIKEA
ncbi:MAG: diguanylate cyclase, partial [Oscillospiraceae bacterium]|nr:diguanylate cyclase [Oscillospiraceae bacterium]